MTKKMVYVVSFPTLTLILLAGVAFAWTPIRYTGSVHGDSQYGVNRDSMSTGEGYGYAKGNCAHCHEQHASIGGVEPSPERNGPSEFLLFKDPHKDQDTNFCFYCHQRVSHQVGGISNYNYSRTFGGRDNNSPTNIKDAFALGPPLGTTGSSHNLTDIRNLIKNNVTWGYADKNSACVGCHNSHIVQKNNNTPYAAYKTAIIIPSQHETYSTNLWGDEAGSGFNEMMSEYTLNYQAPYCYGGSPSDPKYEPSGKGSTWDGSDLPNFVDLCLDCHINQVRTSDHDTSIRRISWLADGDFHGNKPRKYNGSGAGDLKAPYKVNKIYGKTNFVLCCTDCHEPHGSTNDWLLRTCVNGKTDINITENGDWLEFCKACHTLSNIHVGKCSECHIHGAQF
jgi:hypothetical protein